VLAPGGLVPVFAEHLGTAFLRTILADAGIGSVQYLPGHNVGLSTFAAFLRDQAPRVVGLTAYESNLRATRALAEVTHEVLPDTVVVVGGPNATFSPDETLARLGADVCLRGAGEGSIVELVGAVLGDHAPRRRITDLLAGIPNLVLRGPGAPVHTQLGDLSSFPTDRFRTLDELPSPYQRGFVQSADTGMLTARGCNQRCTYCSFATISGRRVHYHSVERVLDDLAAVAALIDRGGKPAPDVSIFDDAFTLSPTRAQKICEGIIAHGLRLRMICETRVDRVTPELLRVMKRAGFVGISFGLDSAVPHVLRAIGKVQDPHTEADPKLERECAYLEDVRRAVAQARAAGLTPSVSVIGGLPGETARDFRATLDFVEKLGATEYVHNILMVLPGTPLHASRHEHHIEAGRDLRTGQWRTRHAYDVASIQPTRRSMSVRMRRDEARELTDALCGRPRPERSCDGSAWAVVLHDVEPDERVTAWLSQVLAVHGTVAVLSTRRRLAAADRDTWMAALERSHTAYGLLAMLYRVAAAPRFEVLRSLGASGGHELVLGRSWHQSGKSIQSDELGWCRVPVWLASTAPRPPPMRPVTPLVTPAAQIADACRWWSRSRRCAHPQVLHVWADGHVAACWGGPALGRVGDTHPQLAARGRELATHAAAPGREQGCPLDLRAGSAADLTPLEVASMVRWLLEHEALNRSSGADEWPRRRQARAGRRSPRRRPSAGRPPRPRSRRPPRRR